MQSFKLFPPVNSDSYIRFSKGVNWFRNQWAVAGSLQVALMTDDSH